MPTSPKRNSESPAIDFWNIVAQYRRIPNGPSVESWQTPTEMQRRRKTDLSELVRLGSPDVSPGQHATPQKS